MGKKTNEIFALLLRIKLTARRWRRRIATQAESYQAHFGPAAWQPIAFAVKKLQLLPRFPAVWQPTVIYDQAVKILGESGYYDIHVDMWRSLDVSRQGYGEQQLRQLIRSHALLYGRAVFSANNSLRQIDPVFFAKCVVDVKNNTLLQDEEIIYTNLCINKKRLLKLVELLKNELTGGGDAKNKINVRNQSAC